MVAVNKGPPITHKLVDQLMSRLPVFFIGVLFRLLMENRHQQVEPVLMRIQFYGR